MNSPACRMRRRRRLPPPRLSANCSRRRRCGCRPCALAGALLAALIWGVYLALILRAIGQGRRDVGLRLQFRVRAACRSEPSKWRETRCWWRSPRWWRCRRRAARRRWPHRRCWRRCALLALYGALDQVMAVRPAAPRRRRHEFRDRLADCALGRRSLVLGVVCMALARQIGVLHQRIAPAGALSLRQPLKLGEMPRRK